MDNEKELIQVTIRLPLKVKEKIDSLAKSGGCSTAEIIRRSVDGSLNEFLDAVQFVDREQGEAIKELLGSVYTELSGMKMELHRIGVNYNQEVRLKNLERKFKDKQISMTELMDGHQAITEECKGLSPEALDGIMERFDTCTEDFVNAMAYTRISHTRNGKAAIRYARGNGRGHNGHAKRNLLMCGVGMLPDEIMSFEEQMQQDWEKASKKNKNQIRRIVISFSEKELDPQDEDSAYLALDMAQEFVEEAYPNRKAAIFVQNDGKGGKLHIHALVSNVDSVNYTGCTDEQTGFEYVKRHFNRVAGKHITLDKGEKAEEKLSQNERRMQQENEEAIENGGAVTYIWKDDLRERIQIAMDNANSENDFLEALEDEGVTARYGTSRRHGEYISYELLDVPDHMKSGDRKYKARSYTLGEAYGVEALREKLREKAKEMLGLTGQRSDTAESKTDFPDTPQESRLHMEPRSQAPVNHALEMVCNPARKPMSTQKVRGIINNQIGTTRREAGVETPIPAQPAHTTSHMAAEETFGTNSTIEQKQPVQSEKVPQKGRSGAYAEIKSIAQRPFGTNSTIEQKQPVQSEKALKKGRSGAYAEIKSIAQKIKEEEARKQLENQHNDMNWVPHR